jgi:hypothetical protein
MKGRIDIIGAAFGASNRETPAGESAHQPERDDRLATARSQRRNDEP